MPLLKASERVSKEQIRFNIDVKVLERIGQYCEWAGINKLENFFIQASEHVLEKDKEWQEYSKSLSKNSVVIE